MKKRIFVMLGVSLVLGGGLFNVSASAEEDAISIETQVVSTEVRKYATDNYLGFISGMLHTEGTSENSAEFKLSEPFQFFSDDSSDQNTTVFPIIKNGEIRYTLYVVESSEGMNGSISKNLVDELKGLKETDNTESISLIENADNIYYENDGTLVQLYDSPYSIDDENEIDISKADQIKEDTDLETEEVNILDSTKLNPRPSISTRAVFKNEIINQVIWNISETQGQNSWCSAYAASAILNNKNDKRPTTVNDMVTWAQKPIDKGFSVDEVIAYANSRNVAPYWVNRKLTKAEITAQVNKSNAVWGYWKGTGNTYIKAVHAIDILGTYSFMGFEGYFVWNPWDTNISLIDASQINVSLPVNGGSFVWTGSITNW